MYVFQLCFMLPNEIMTNCLLFPPCSCTKFLWPLSAQPEGPLCWISDVCSLFLLKGISGVCVGFRVKSQLLQKWQKFRHQQHLL